MKFIGAISGWDKLRLIAKPGNDYLFDDLLKIIRELVSNDKIYADQRRRRLKDLIIGSTKELFDI